MNSPVIKTLVLCCFVVLLSSFVAYRTGYFDKYLYAQNNTPEIEIDSPDVESNERMSGSKIMVLPKQSDTKPVTDSNRVTEEEIWNMTTREIKDVPENYMGSSKSAPVFEPSRGKDSGVYYIDGKKVTGSKLLKQPDTAELERQRMRMVSSKSAYVLDPVRDSLLIDAIKRKAAADESDKVKRKKQQQKK